MNKNKALATIGDMPQDFDLEVLLEKLIFIEKVEKGLKQVESGKMISHADVKQRVKQWSK
ncbi:hypothetical protein ACVW0P_000047 [Mucilaginibacter sp. UYNi724]